MPKQKPEEDPLQYTQKSLKFLIEQARDPNVKKLCSWKSLKNQMSKDNIGITQNEMTVTYILPLAV